MTAVNGYGGRVTDFLDERCIETGRVMEIFSDFGGSTTLLLLNSIATHHHLTSSILS